MKRLICYVIGMALLFCLVSGSSVLAGMQVAAGASHTVGLKADGTVVAVGDNDSGQCNLFDWNLLNSECSTWSDVISKYNAYVSGQASWSDVIQCYQQYVSP